MVMGIRENGIKWQLEQQFYRVRTNIYINKSRLLRLFVYDKQKNCWADCSEIFHWCPTYLREQCKPY